MPDVATPTAHQESSPLNVLILADYHPRRVARALARDDAHITFGLTPKQPLSMDDIVTEEMEAAGRERSVRRGEKHAPYLRTEVVLPDELQGIEPELLYAGMCGDAVFVLQASSVQPVQPYGLADFALSRVRKMVEA